MRFQVPQFIEVEDKIFGPLTIKQFIYLVGGGGFAYILKALLPSYIAYLLIPPVIIFALALAFYKVNEKPFINVVEAAFMYVIGNKLYIWKKQDKKIDPKVQEEKAAESLLVVPKMSHSKLKDLAWSLDVNDKSDGTIYDAESKTLEKRKTYSNAL